MNERPSASQPEIPPNEAVFQMASSLVMARCLYSVAELRVADHLDENETKSIDDLAEASGALTDPLYRIMRLLAMGGVFREIEARSFCHTPMSVTLRSDHSTRARAAVMLASGPLFWRGFDHLSHTVKTGETSFDVSVGRSFFEFLWDHPEHSDNFGDAMIGVHGGEPPAVAQAYEFSSLGTIVDLGGGTGNLLVHILRRHPGVRAVLYETEHVTKATRSRIETEGLSDRCDVVEGSFFEAVPEDGDAYLLFHIIHDWDEERCGTILANCRRAMRPGSKLLIVEMVVTPPAQPHPSKMLDIVMLAMTGGRERTEDEYRTLLAAAGLRVTRVLPTESPVSIVEAVRDDEVEQLETHTEILPIPWI